ncbi:MAG: glycosyltransferase family 2 protein [Lachnospiraceae bacterium]|jgi:dolichol-phosphate mannosyltransferase|nr:glycosyltransferase family 2 protein [Lachnospiraceae bacterium]
MALLSIILPAYNEEENIRPITQTLSALLEEKAIQFELLFISDGSTDETFARIKEEQERDDRVRGVQFSRNFGKEAAIFAGLQYAKGDAVVVMDCDLQHPPETLPRMWALWQDGYEIVEGQKSKRGTESLWYKISAGLFYHIMSGLLKMNMNASSDFKLLDRKVVDVLLSLPERNTFFRAMTFWTGFRRVTVEYEVAKRQYGKSKWSMTSLLRYAVKNATSFSTMPLQIVTVAGMLFLLFSFLLGIQTLVKYLSGTAVEGFTTVILLMLIIGGFILISLGIIGHYIARIYEEVKGRPKYIVSAVCEKEES